MPTHPLAIDLTGLPSPNEARLDIPNHIQALILPSKSLSVMSLLRSSIIPGPCGLLEPELYSADEWISVNPPDAIFEPQHLPQIPLPPIALVKALTATLLSIADPGTARSITVTHLSNDTRRSLPQQLPLWAVTYWALAHKARTARQTWRTALEWATRWTGGSLQGREELRQLKSNLAHLGWDDSLSGELQPSTTLSSVSDYLPSFLSHGRLTGTHIDQLLVCVRRQLENSPDLSWELSHAIQVVGPDLVSTIVTASQDTGENILTLSRYNTLRMLEFDLVNGHCTSVGGIIFVNENHYTFFVLRPEEKFLGYGDSMGGQIPAVVRKALLWWIERMLSQGMPGAGDSPVDMWLRHLPVTAQASSDDFSCGVLAVNALTHHYLPHVPLMNNSRSSVSLDRVSAFNEVCKIHLDSLPDSALSPFAKLSVDAKFEFSFPAPKSVSSQGKDTSSVQAATPNSGFTSFPTLPSTEPCLVEPANAPNNLVISNDRSRLFSNRDSIDGEKNLNLESDSAKRPRHASHIPHSLHINDPTTVSSPAHSAPRTTDKTASKAKVLATTVKQAAKRVLPAAFAKFMPISREQLLEQNKIERMVKDERREEIAEREAEAKERKDSKIREQNRLRKARERERKRQASSADITDDAPGSSKVLKLRKYDDVSHAQLSSKELADASRPFRQFKEELRAASTETRGRKPNADKKHEPSKGEPRPAWMNPLLFQQIQSATLKVGYPWSPTEIVQYLRQINPEVFNRLDPRRISEWRNTDISDRLVWKDWVQECQKKKHRMGGTVTRVGILSSYPELTKMITKMLEELRAASATVNVPTVRAIIIGYITHHAPEIFEKEDKNGRRFTCSEAWVRRFLRRVMDWSLRKSTRAGQKVPENAPDLLRKSFLRASAVVRDGKIAPCFVVNTDQTQCVYSHDASKTWTKKGEKQVATAGKEEKRAFTLVVGVSQNGDVLPFQAIYQGSDPRQSLPKKTSPRWDDAMALRIRFEVSKTSTYWSTLATMQSYVTNILVPHLEAHKARLGLSFQRCLWIIDVWSVHRSLEFRAWMRATYPWITVNYIPGGCTGLWQPADVGIQRPLKHAIRRSAHHHVICETMEKLSSGTMADKIKLDTKIGVIRDRSVEWLVNGYNAINDPSLVQKAWELCRVPNTSFNFSHNSVDSEDARQALNKLARDDPGFYAEITAGASENAVVDESCAVEEDVTAVWGLDDGDSIDLSLAEVKARTADLEANRDPSDNSDTDDGSDAEGADSDEEYIPSSSAHSAPVADNLTDRTRRLDSEVGKRVRRPNTRYHNAYWTRFDASDDEL